MSNITITANNTFQSYLTERCILSEPPRSSDGRLLSIMTREERLVDAYTSLLNIKDQLILLGDFTDHNADHYNELLDAMYWSEEYLADILNERNISKRLVDAYTPLLNLKDQLIDLGDFTDQNADQCKQLLDAIYWSEEYLAALLNELNISQRSA